MVGRPCHNACLYRDCEVVVSSLTDAPIPWPRCQPLHCRGGWGLLVTEELVRAIRTEWADTLKRWWGSVRIPPGPGIR